MMGWMFFLFFLLCACQGLCVAFARPVFAGGGDGRDLFWVLVFSALGLGLYAGAVRLGEKRWPGELAPRFAARELLLGLLMGAGMFGLVMAVLVGLGFYQLEGPRLASPVGAVAQAITSGVMEELLFRAVLLRLLTRAFGLGWALGLSAALFGLLHMNNPNATLMAALAIAVEAGPLLAAFYLLTGRLWMSIGVHAAWNFTQAFVFGASVSGVVTHRSLFVGSPRAGVSEALSGGVFGPEASLPAMVIGAGVAVVVFIAAHRKATARALELHGA
ncbi:hypothetical protein BON30_47055 [Cystobacter ferrugineus]|uniref:CAAX prenyl protease 2/Lysostaphin resistance protein A-like domain-containing protein n=2 Tax=Cystobacter ferrugineus TaxID=83449 RepID=A0A1L9AUW5_9BACT|nr:hypothetical protein BON30_47055 [Cystobacter ferrugineus]